MLGKIEGRRRRGRQEEKVNPLRLYPLKVTFPDSSIGKEPACNAGDPGSIPGLGRYAGEGRGYPLQYSWASLVAQLVKNPPAMRETWVWSLGRCPGEGKGYPCQYSGRETSMDCIVHGVTKSQTWLSDFHFTPLKNKNKKQLTSIRCHVLWS